jgi:branched-chain amino acid transport system permease protein
MEAFFYRFANDFVMISIYLVLALSLNLINGYAGLFSLGHAGFWAVGAYVGSAFVVYVHEAYAVIPAWALFGGSLATGMLGAALAGLIIGLPCLRLKGDYLAIATLGFSIVVVNIIENINAVGGARSFPFGAHEKPDGAIFQLTARAQHNVVNMAFAFVAVVICAAVIRNLVRSSHGRAIQSIREDELAGEMCGINMVAYKLFVFVLGAAFAGMAGVLYATYQYRITAHAFDFMEGVRILLMVVLGGMGSMTGTFVAVIVLYELPELLRLSSLELFGYPVADYWKILYALLLIILMLARPQGLLGRMELSDLAAAFRARLGRAGRRGK